MNRPNQPVPQLYMRDDSPNFMMRHITPVSQLDFHANPDMFTEENERLQAKIGAEVMRQEFDNLINTFNEPIEDNRI